MSTNALQQTVFSDLATRWPHFFNGRLLSKEDLTLEHESNREQQRCLSWAIGDGVAHGLEVFLSTDDLAAAPTLVVTAGLALNKNGRAIQLHENVAVPLTKPVQAGVLPTNDMAFDDCEPVSSDPYVYGAGLYVLTVAPAQRTEGAGRALASGLAPGVASCNVQYDVEGAQFRLIQFTIATLGDLNTLRNRVAYQCFSRDALGGFVADPFGPAAEPYGLMDALRAQGVLTRCEVPLATLFWQDRTVQWVDMWSVRRRITRPNASGAWSALLSERRVAEAEAMLLQFEEHMQALLSLIAQQPQLAAKDLSTFFTFLPPVGVVPIVGAGSASGFELTPFFGSRAPGAPTVIDVAHVERLFRQALALPPMPVNDVDLLQLYWNDDNLNQVAGGTTKQRYALFVTRDAHGFLENDDVVQTMAQTWKSYASLLQKGILLPKTFSDRSRLVWMALQTNQQTVTQFAMTRESAAAAGQLNRTAVIATFRELYQLQKEVVVAARQTFDGDTGLSERQSLAELLDQRLHSPNPVSAPGLKPALDADKVRLVLKAQQVINTLLGTWAGEVAFGVIQIGLPTGSRGTKIKPGDALPYPFQFQITNLTDQRVTVALSASIVESKSGTWGNAVSLSPATLSLNPMQESPVVVQVTAPADANLDEPVRLQLIATLPPPNDQQWTRDVILTTSATSGQPEVWRLVSTLAQKPSQQTLDNVAPQQTLSFWFSTEFAADQEPKKTQCTITLTSTFTNSARSDWGVAIQASGATEQPSNSGVLKHTFLLPGNGSTGNNLTQVKITAPASKKNVDQDCTFTIAVAAQIINPQTGAPVDLKHDIPETFKVTLKK